MTNNNKPKEKFKFDEKTLNTLLYVGAALLVVVILAVSIFAFASRSKKNETPVTSGVSTAAPKVTDAPTTTATPTTTSRVDNIDKPTVSVPSYVFPVEGTLAKGHDSETLVYSVTMNDYRVHTGIDINAPVGSAVYAVASGTIKGVYQDYLMGTTVEIEHADGVVSYYKNLSATLPDGITEGSAVTSGQLIGAVGESAIIEQCDDPHLHFEMKKDGADLDPLNYLAYGKNSETVEK